MTNKWQKNDTEMTKKWQKHDKKMTTQIQNDKPKCKKNATKMQKKWQNNYFGISNVCRPKIFLRVKPKILSNNTGNCGLFFLRSVGVSRGPFSGTATVQDRGEILKKNRSFLQCQRFVGDLGKYPCCKALAHGFSHPNCKMWQSILRGTSIPLHT